MHVAMNAAAAGWFGKLACVGDFASRRLPVEFTQACDAWLSGCIEASRAQLGDRWLDAYLTSPLWRFAWAPGVLDARWWCGVLMPSVDGVGRYFPLLIAQPADAAPCCAMALERLEQWFEHLAEAALHTLEPAATLERFETELAQAPAWPDAAALQAPEQWPDRVRHPLPVDATFAQTLQRFGTDAALRQLRGCTLWSALRRDHRASSLSVAVGLPAAASFAQLLEGVW